MAAARGGYAKQWLREQFLERFGGDHPPDWQVATTFDRALQDAAERSVQDGLRGLGIEGLQAALVAMDPTTGDVLALVGGRDARGVPLRPRDQGAAPARLGLQADRLRRGARARVRRR